MKKAIFLSAAALLSLSAFCQDTLNKQSKPLNKFDTIPTENKWNNDTSSWNNKNKTNVDTFSQGNKQWNSDTSSRKNQMNEDTTGLYRKGETSDSAMHQADPSLNQPVSPAAMDSTKRTTPDVANDSMKSKKTEATPDKKETDAKPAGADLTDTSSMHENLTDRIAMAEDKIYVVKNGKSSLLEKSYKLESGVIVLADGTVKYPTGKSVSLKNGQFIELPKKEKTAPSAPVKKKKITKKS